jgi:hypothetical protein
MTHHPLSFQYQGSTQGNFTSFAGLPLFLEMAQACGLEASIKEQMQLKTRGWTDSQMILSLLVLNIAGGDCVEDINRLEADEGLKTLLLEQECKGMDCKTRCTYRKRFRKLKSRALPSPSAIRRYLEEFHDKAEEDRRGSGEAFIPQANEAFNALNQINKTMVDFAQTHQPCRTATLDQDATLAETNKRTALYCYKKFKAYQPFNTYWHEQGLLLHSEFRDGNVPAGFEQLRFLKEALSKLPQGIDKVCLRSDSAGYQEDLLQYCARGDNEGFGVIEFAIAAKVSQSFKVSAQEVGCDQWIPIYAQDENGNKIKTNQEWAEVGFVPSWAGKSKKAPDYRYIAIRERMWVEASLPGLEEDPVQQELPLDLPFQTLKMRNREYKLFGIVTNRTIDGNDLINWHRERCGDSEKVHSIEKGDLAGGQFPSSKFGANAAWWQIMVLALNLKALMQKLVLPDFLKNRRMKGPRFHLVNIAGCVVSHARRVILRVSNHADVIGLLNLIRSKIAALAHSPPGRVLA